VIPPLASIAADGADHAAAWRPASMRWLTRGRAVYRLTSCWHLAQVGDSPVGRGSARLVAPRAWWTTKPLSRAAKRWARNSCSAALHRQLGLSTSRSRNAKTQRIFNKEETFSNSLQDSGAAPF